jgi:hypothetical protein
MFSYRHDEQTMDTHFPFTGRNEPHLAFHATTGIALVGTRDSLPALDKLDIRKTGIDE